MPDSSGSSALLHDRRQNGMRPQPQNAQPYDARSRILIASYPACEMLSADTTHLVRLLLPALFMKQYPMAGVSPQRSP